MKDMTVEELEHGMKLVINSDAVDLIGKMAITNTWNELLRRFEALEKENEELKTELDHLGMTRYYCPVCLVKTENDNLACCGNCTQHESRQCPKYDEYRRTGLWTLAWHYCDHYKSDGLTREEREGK